MKKIIFDRCILLAFILSVSITACKKNDTAPDSNYGISAAIDGTPVFFKALLNADTSRSGTISISAFVNTTTFSPYITMVLTSNPHIAKGDYPFTPANGNSSLLTYNDWNHSLQTYTSSDDFVTITSTSTTSITGTFRATVQFYQQDPLTGQMVLDSAKVISNGVFNLPLGRG